MKPAPKVILQFQQTIWDYYKRHGRQFPWRPPSSMVGELRRGKGDLDPYGVLVSEVMLQQTQVDRVIPKYLAWMQTFPNLESLAGAKLSEVLKRWQGLGYNRRALNLKRAAEKIVKEHDGTFPKTMEEINALPGVGPYTAGAIAAFAFGIPSAFIETNIRAVYLHFFFKGRKKVRDEEILEMVGETLPAPPNKVQPFSRFKIEPCSVREWYSALMDYGAMLKRTEGNPNARSAHHTRQKKFAGSRRELRGEILRRATRQKTIAPGEFANGAFSVPGIFADLVREGFLRKTGNTFRLA